MYCVSALFVTALGLCLRLHEGNTAPQRVVSELRDSNPQRKSSKEGKEETSTETPGVTTVLASTLTKPLLAVNSSELGEGAGVVGRHGLQHQKQGKLERAQSRDTKGRKMERVQGKRIKPSDRFDTPQTFCSKQEKKRCDKTGIEICPRDLRCGFTDTSDDTDDVTDDVMSFAPRSRCGEGFCCCCDCLANCSRHYGKLTHIPQLPAHTTIPDFSGNGIKEINDSSFFENVTSLRYLDLGNNDLQTVDPGSFELFDNLTVLLLNDNVYLDFTKNAHAVFNLSSLEVLDLSNAYAGTLPADTFQQYAMPRLKELVMNNVDLRHWNATMFQRLTSLEVLHVGDNDMRHIYTEDIDQFLNLAVLNLDQNDMYSFPKTCLRDKSIYPALVLLYLSNNRITKLPKKLCLPKLQLLNLKCNPIHTLGEGNFSAHNFPSLKKLFLEHLGVEKIEAFTFNSSSLIHLYLEFNYIDFLGDGVHVDSFRNLPHLQRLILEQNYLSNSRCIELFSGLTELRVLHLGNTNLDEVTVETFASFPKLNTIILHWNFLARIPDGVFDSLPKLHKLDLSHSRETSVGKHTFSRETRGRLHHLDINGRHFRCDCDLLWFRDWLKSGDRVFSGHSTEAMCKNLANTKVVDFTMNEQVCLMSHVSSGMTIFVVTLLTTILAVVALLFRYRWHMRLALYEAFRGRGHDCPLQANQFRYDIFVSFADEDLPWVRHHLIPTLEDDQGLRLCIHHRDFMPGENIVDNIFTGVQTSRKVMMVFSRHFARSQWCQFELALALHDVIDRGDALLIVCVDDVTCGGELTRTMMAVLQTTTYIQWGEDPDVKASFWGRLAIALSGHVCQHAHE